MPQKDTEELFQEIRQSENAQKYLQDYEDILQNYSLSEYLTQLLAEHKLEKRNIIKASRLEEKSAYHIFSGIIKQPNRKKLLMLALAMGLDIRETQHLLHYGGAAALYPKDAWDSVLIYAINKHLSIIDVNLLLDEVGQMPLQ